MGGLGSGRQGRGYPKAEHMPWRSVRKFPTFSLARLSTRSTAPARRRDRSTGPHYLATGRDGKATILLLLSVRFGYWRN